MTRILLGQLGANGDCLYATALARQIKADFPGCHLTWAVGSLSRAVLAGNPDIDVVWELPMAGLSDMARLWSIFAAEAQVQAEAGHFDHVFLTQISPGRLAHYDGTVRPSLFRSFGRPVTLPVDVTIVLTEQEEAAADRWFAESPAADAAEVVLFECANRSGQSFMDVGIARQVAARITAARPRAAVIISTHEKLDDLPPRVVSGHALGIRQTARLTRHVDLFIGCGSGLTVAATSGAARAGLPNIQVLKAATSVYASFRTDFAYFGKPTVHFLEITREDPGHVADAAIAALAEGIAAARHGFGDPVSLSFGWYREVITHHLLERGLYVEAVQSLLTTAGRFGWHEELRRFGRHMILPFMAADPRATLPHRRAELDRLRAEMDAK